MKFNYKKFECSICGSKLNSPMDIFAYKLSDGKKDHTEINKLDFYHWKCCRDMKLKMWNNVKNMHDPENILVSYMIDQKLRHYDLPYEIKNDIYLLVLELYDMSR